MHIELHFHLMTTFLWNYISVKIESIDRVPSNVLISSVITTKLTLDHVVYEESLISSGDVAFMGSIDNYILKC